MLGLLNRHILRKLWPPALLGLFVVSFIAISISVQQSIGSLMRDVPITPITVKDIARMAIYALPTLVVYILPITFLMSVMLAFGRMAHDGEITAVKAAGIPLKRIVAPVVIAGAVTCGFCFLMQDLGQPWAYRKMMNLLLVELPTRPTLEMLPTGAMHQFGSWRVYIRERAADGSLRDVVVLRPNEEGQTESIYADRADLREKDGVRYLEMVDCYYLRTEEGESVAHTYAESLSIPLPELSPRSPRRAKEGMNLAALFSQHQILAEEHTRAPSEASVRALRRNRNEIGTRFSLPLMCLAVTIVAAPIGARARRAGRSYLFTAGFILGVGYFLIHELLEPKTLQSLGATIFLGQIPNLMLCSLGGLLLWRVDRV